MSSLSGIAAAKRFAVPAITAWCAEILTRAGVSKSQSEITARVLVRTDARGFRTHGLMRLPSYLEKLRAGEVSANAEVNAVVNGSYGTVEASAALGQFAGSYTIERAVEMTNSQPLVGLMLRDTGHLGALGILALQAAEAGRVAYLLQATPPIIAMPGASGPMLGNNPFAIAAPRTNGPPIVVDMACSVAARGNILLAARSGESIPEGWAVDENGDPTTNAPAALKGSLLPFAGHKGMGVSIIVELLAGSLSGRPFESTMNKGGQVRSASGHLNALFLVFNPDLMIGRDAYNAHVEAWTSHYKSAGGNARIPGERAHFAEVQAAKEGLSLAKDVCSDLEQIGAEYSLPLPQPIT